jgi:hypothetical protein
MLRSSAILVYRNKAVFENRKLSDNEGKEEPLDPGESLGLFGSKDEMLIVLVPSKTPRVEANVVNNIVIESFLSQFEYNGSSFP